MTLKTDNLQVGASGTAANNFILSTDNAGGMKLQRGVIVGGVPTPTADILAVDSGGGVTFTKPPATAAGAAPILQARHSANQSGLTPSAYNKVVFQTVPIDTATGWSVANNRYQPNVAGWYQVSWGVEINGTTINYIIASIYKNGAIASMGQAITGVSTSVIQVSGSRPIYLNGSTDFIEVWAYFQAAGAAIAADAAGTTTFFDATYLRP